MGDDVIHVAFEGVLDRSKREAFVAALPTEPLHEKVVIDLSEVKSIHLTVLTELARYRRKFITSGRSAHDLLLVAGSEVRKQLQAAGLANAFTVLPSERTGTNG